jgi:hypothetical protein
LKSCLQKGEDLLNCGTNKDCRNKYLYVYGCIHNENHVLLVIIVYLLCYTFSMKMILVSLVVAGLIGGVVIWRGTHSDTPSNPVTPATQQEQAAPIVTETPAMITVSGAYVCLPTIDGSATADCAFGIKTDGGEYYAVNFGASAGSMADFASGAHIAAQGTLILREDLRPDSWKKFKMKGLFTILEKQ